MSIILTDERCEKALKHANKQMKEIKKKNESLNHSLFFDLTNVHAFLTACDETSNIKLIKKRLNLCSYILYWLQMNTIDVNYKKNNSFATIYKIVCNFLEMNNLDSKRIVEHHIQNEKHSCVPKQWKVKIMIDQILSDMVSLINFWRRRIAGMFEKYRSYTKSRENLLKDVRNSQLLKGVLNYNHVETVKLLTEKFTKKHETDYQKLKDSYNNSIDSLKSTNTMTEKKLKDQCHNLNNMYHLKFLQYIHHKNYHGAKKLCNFILHVIHPLLLKFNNDDFSFKKYKYLNLDNNLIKNILVQAKTRSSFCK
jgi:hypothetical protein